MSASRCSPLRWIVADGIPPLRRPASVRVQQDSAKPRMAVMGVRISWLMLARNSLLASVAASAVRGLSEFFSVTLQFVLLLQHGRRRARLFVAYERGSISPWRASKWTLPRYCQRKPRLPTCIAPAV